MLKIYRDQEEIEIMDRLSILPLKEVVVFPYMVFPLLVGREPSLRAIQEAMMHNKLIFLAAQKDQMIEEPDKDDLYRYGVVAKILQVLKLPNGLMKVLVEGLVRGRIQRFLPYMDHFEARIDPIEDEEKSGVQIQALMRKASQLFRAYVNLNPAIADEILLSLEGIRSHYRLVYYIGAHLKREVALKQQILEIEDPVEQLMFVIQVLESEKQILEIEQQIDEKVRDRIQRSQRNFYLQEQMRVIQEELGEQNPMDGELGKLREKIHKARMPKAVEEKALEELDKLRNMPPISPEATVIRNYLDWLIAVPWYQKTRDTLDIQKAKKILDEDHYGLEKPKERILEHLAVLKLVKKIKGPILCLVGPPGVGKTSLGRSIARAMGRQFVRVSLGGVRDEAEIRGHRRTYIGAMPGRIVQNMKRAKTINPVFLLDEVDKMSMDFRGDPAAALLEVLDPEQNKAFNDHYLEVDYDLSNVLFITTANVRANIPEPLQDRMEIIELPGYLEHEKLQIALGYLLPKLMKEYGLDPDEVTFTRPAILKIIREYTREAGVRNLERELASICRKIAKAIAMSNGRTNRKFRIGVEQVVKYLGVPRYQSRQIGTVWGPGRAIGLAWTQYGGELLEIEVNVVDGKGNLTLTGKLGEVMQESAKAALSYIRSKADALNIPKKYWDEKDIHIHIPEGAIPKDGPSAGITMAVALISAINQQTARKDVAMTGEITLSGKVLPIGGLNEKVLAAQRFGIKHVIVPAENRKDIKELPAPLRKGVVLHTVTHMDEVLDIAFANEVVEPS